MDKMIKYTELYDYIVGLLYEFKTRGKLVNKEVSLTKLINWLHFNASIQEVFQVGRYLEAEGFITATFVIGDVLVKITPLGLVYWEKKEESFIKKFHHCILKTSKKNSKEEESSIKEVIHEIMSELDTQHSLKEKMMSNVTEIVDLTKELKDKNPDLHLDAEILKLELNKNHPDKDIIISKLYQLDKYSFIHSNVLKIKEWLDIER